MAGKKEGPQAYSRELLAAQKRLLQLRQEARQARIDADLPVDVRLTMGAHRQTDITQVAATSQRVLQGAAGPASGQSSSSIKGILQNLPDHLGWGSLSPDRRRVTIKTCFSHSHLDDFPQPSASSCVDRHPDHDVSALKSPCEPPLQNQPQLDLPKPMYRQKEIQLEVPAHFQVAETEKVAPSPAQLPLAGLTDDPTGASISTNQEGGQIKIFGHVLDGIHRCKKDGTGRVWLLLRYMDREKGEGRVLLRDVRYKLTDPNGSLKCLSKKRLQQLIRAGDGVFWHKSADSRYLYYHSEARVAAAIGLSDIRGFALEIPVLDLLKPIRHVRALFHDAFHSARQEGYGNPITRRVMQDRGMSDGRTQRKYEALRGMHNRSEFAVIEKYSKAAWQRAQHEDADERIGGPAFVFVDYKGILGKNPDRFKRPKGKRHWHNIYIMRQVGNAYAGSLKTAKRGRHWTSKKLRYLCASMQTVTGSAGEDGRSDEEIPWCGKYYYESDKEIQRQMRREGGGDNGIEGRPRYCPSPELDLDWNKAIGKEDFFKMSQNSFYWQECFFVD